MLDKLRIEITTFFNSLTQFDYYGFSITLMLFITLLLLALKLRRRTKISLFFIFISFTALFYGPVFIHGLVKDSLFKHTAKLEQIKQLHYSDTLLLKGTLNYLGKYDASFCKVYTSVIKQSENFFKDIAYNIKPMRKGETKIMQTLTKGDSVKFKVVIEPFNYAGDYNITLRTSCYK